MRDTCNFMGKWMGTTIALTGVGFAPAFFAGLIGGRFFESVEDSPYGSLQQPSGMAAGIGGAIIFAIFTFFLYPVLRINMHPTPINRSNSTTSNTIKTYGLIVAWLVYITIASSIGNLIQDSLDADHLPLGRQTYIALTGAALVTTPIIFILMLALLCSSRSNKDGTEPDLEASSESTPLFVSSTAF